MMLQAKNLSVTRGGKQVVRSVSFSVREGEWWMLLGPNGAGKSSLIMAASGACPYQGSVTLGGQEVSALRPRTLARQMAVLSQTNAVSYGFLVEDVVRLGRYAYRRGMLAPSDPQEQEMVERALEWTGTAHLRRRSMKALSGGEVQRVFLAQVLAQDPNILILDEPTSSLDLHHQHRLFELVAEWVKQPGKAVVSAVHDLSVARRYGSHALLLSLGGMAAVGAMDAALTDGVLNRVYRLPVREWMRDMLSQWR